MRKELTVAVALSLIMLAGGAGADLRTYLQAGLGDTFLQCHPSGDFIGAGGVCWPGGHIGPNSAGQATLSINDSANNPASGFYCQDFDADQVCGHGDTVAQGRTAGRSDPDDEIRGQGLIHFEPAVHFCAAVVIESPLDSTPRTKAAWAAGENWDLNDEVYVFIDGPVFGSGVGGENPCGTLYSGGTVGDVTHT